MSEQTPQIRAEKVTFHYAQGITALKDVSFCISPGERVALAGPNGSGKSTLARHFNGLLKPSAGRFWIEDMDTSVKNVAQLSKKIALLFQNPDDQICKRLVRDEVAFGPDNLGYSKGRSACLVNNALELFDLSNVQDQNPHDLGFSERKRVLLASVVAMDTPVLVLDEPTAGFDPHEIRLFITALDQLEKERKTVLIITHDMDFVSENIVRAICLAKGEKVFDGDPLDLFSNQALLSVCSLYPPQVVRLSFHFQQKKPARTPMEFIAEF